MASIKLHIFFENGLCSSGCNCNSNITLEINKNHLPQTKLSLKCSFHYQNLHFINIDFKDINGEQAKNIKDVKSIIVSQEIRQSNKADVEYEHYAHWRNMQHKRKQEIKDLKNDHEKILDKLNYESSNSDSLDDINKHDLYEEMTLIGKQIRNHNQEIAEMKKSSSELEYEDCIYINSLKLLCCEYKKFVLYQNASDKEEYIKKYDRGSNCEILWNFYGGKSDKKSSMKRKDVSQEIHKLKLPKLHKCDH